MINLSRDIDDIIDEYLITFYYGVMIRKEIHSAMQEFTLPAYHEIPDVGLYLDQVTKYLNSYFSKFPDFTVTPSMITNSVKQKLVKRLNKKTYTRDQIAQFIFISIAKTVLSLDHIRTLLSREANAESFENSYNYFRTILLHVLAEIGPGKALFADNKKLTEDEEMLEYIAVTAGHKMFLEKYFALSEEVSSD